MAPLNLDEFDQELVRELLNERLDALRDRTISVGGELDRLDQMNAVTDMLRRLDAIRRGL